MEEADAEIVLQPGRVAYPQARPRIISNRGSQFVARDFKDPVTTRVPSGVVATACTGEVWPLSVRNVWPVFMSQSGAWYLVTRKPRAVRLA
jgi:hypothetical protein